MHSYSTSTTERRAVHALIFIPSLLLAGSADMILSHYQCRIPWWASLPVSAAAFYAGLFCLFDRFLWKRKPVRWLLQTPVLHGKWKGIIRPALGENVETRPATLTIDQHWSTISVILETEKSESRSTMAAVMHERTSRPSIWYVYENAPHEGSDKAMHKHSGTSWFTLEIKNGESVLVGGYYTGRDRRSTGELEFRRLPNDG